jgi:hypothetical protein
MFSGLLVMFLRYILGCGWINGGECSGADVAKAARICHDDAGLAAIVLLAVLFYLRVARR